ncbi:MAG: FAD:protein FMN transferase [Dehalococcoidia bacterium]|nr:FAD:protein FMN transferase [Dehalococcoidia bacterium]
MSSGAVATSSIGGRRWASNGRAMHHLLDPRTGQPSASDLHSVTVLAPTAADAEVAAKVALILGSRQGSATWRSRNLRGLLDRSRGQQQTVGRLPLSHLNPGQQQFCRSTRHDHKHRTSAGLSRAAAWESAAGAAPHRQQQAIVPDGPETFWGAVLGSLAGLGLATAGLAIGLGDRIGGRYQSYWYLEPRGRLCGLPAPVGFGGLGHAAQLQNWQGQAATACPARRPSIPEPCGRGLYSLSRPDPDGRSLPELPLRAVLVPFAGTHEPALVAAGQLGFWLLLLLVLSSHTRKQLGQAQWRALHYTSFIAHWECSCMLSCSAATRSRAACRFSTW